MTVKIVDEAQQDVEVSLIEIAETGKLTSVALRLQRGQSMRMSVIHVFEDEKGEPCVEINVARMQKLGFVVKTVSDRGENT